MVRDPQERRQEKERQRLERRVPTCDCHHSQGLTASVLTCTRWFRHFFIMGGMEVSRDS